MDSAGVLGIFALGIAIISGGAVAYYYFFPRQESNLRSLMGRIDQPGSGVVREMRQRLREDETGEQLAAVKKITKKKRQVKKEQVSLEDRFFRAGMFSKSEQKDFQRLRITAPLVTTAVAAIGIGYVMPSLAWLGAIFGLLLGLQLPYSVLDRRIKRRDEDIMFYLPLVIEQIAIGVSSSLDIGPCLQRVVSMADERDTHNVVTELVKYAQNHVRSGVSLEDALNEIGKRSGHNELKHSFLSLSQVAKHGGEITRQLQELADAVASQREGRIEAKIKRLELEATLPVTLVFMGFLVILLVGFFIQMKDAL